MRIWKNLLLATAVALLVALGTANRVQAFQFFYGYDQPQNYYGAGVMNSFVTVADNGTPLNVGWTFSKGVLDKTELPAKNPQKTFNLVLPKDASGSNYTVLDHMGLGWRPQGHQPKFAFGATHFDAHFFMISPAQREDIPEAPDTGPFVPPPPPYQNPKPKFVAQGYENSGHYVAGEGAHWVNEKSPEFRGQPFTQTLVYGYDQNGKMHFMEPMITVDILKSLQNQGGKTSITQKINLPTAFTKSGFYPTEYTVTYDPGAARYQYTVKMSGMKYKAANKAG
jgi:hypothetical protein